MPPCVSYFILWSFKYISFEIKSEPRAMYEREIKKEIETIQTVISIHCAFNQCYEWETLNQWKLLHYFFDLWEEYYKPKYRNDFAIFTNYHQSCNSVRMPKCGEVSISKKHVNLYCKSNLRWQSMWAFSPVNYFGYCLVCAS